MVHIRKACVWIVGQIINPSLFRREAYLVTFKKGLHDETFSKIGVKYPETIASKPEKTEASKKDLKVTDSTKVNSGVIP